jgi:hypothetical protein
MKTQTTHKFHPGQYYELTQDVGHIPAGVYLLESFEETSLAFSVGRKRSIHFFICLVDLNLFRPLSFREGKAQRTREADFALKYYDSMRCSRRNVLKHQSAQSQPFVTCFVSESVEAKYGQEFCH